MLVYRLIGVVIDMTLLPENLTGDQEQQGQQERMEEDNFALSYEDSELMSEVREDRKAFRQWCVDLYTELCRRRSLHARKQRKRRTPKQQ